MPTYRGPVKASLAQLAAIAPFLAKSAFASNLEVRTVEVFATTYLDIDACYNACPTKAWQEWQTPVTNYVTQTLPAAESCVTTSTSTKHPDCDVCKGTVFIYVPKTEIVEITKVIDPTHSSHMHKPSFSKHTEHSSVVVKSSSTAPPSSVRSSSSWATSSSANVTSSRATSSATRHTSSHVRSSSSSSAMISSRETTSSVKTTASRATSSSAKNTSTRPTSTGTRPSSYVQSSSTRHSSSYVHTSSTRHPSSYVHTSSTRHPSSYVHTSSTKVFSSSRPSHTHPSSSLGDAAAQCGNHQMISCCNSGNSIGSLLGNLLGGNCSPIDISILGIGIPISSACSGQVACCTGDSNGLINLQCTNVNI